MKKAEERETEMEWRSFEKFVAQIERVLAGPSAKVRSPDRIRSKITGRAREVDVTIRCRVGSVEVLIGIECRRRGAKSDVRWIEELKTKRESLGLDKVIAVSWKGFSKDARASAKHFGIEARRMSEISEEEIRNWPQITLRGSGVSSTVTRVQAGLAPGDDEKRAAEILGAMRDALGDANIHAQIFERDTGLKLSAHEIFENTVGATGDLEGKFRPPTGVRRTETFRVTFDEVGVFVRTRIGPVRLVDLVFDVSLRLAESEVSIAPTDSVSYGPEDEPSEAVTHSVYRSSDCTISDARVTRRDGEDTFVLSLKKSDLAALRKKTFSA